MRKILVTFVPGLIAATVGGYLGSLLFHWIQQQGFYALVIPGALAGLACGFVSIDHSRVRGVICALIALTAGVLSEWKYFSPPVETDGTLIDFLAHFHKQLPITLVMVGLGTFLGFWWGRETTSPWRQRLSKPVSPD